MSLVSIAGLNKADVLAALYNASRPQGMGFLSYSPTPMTREEAQAFLIGECYFDYLKGRVMKLSLLADGFVDTRLYDRDNGEGAGERAIEALRAGDAVAIAEQHRQGVLKAGARAMNRMASQSNVQIDGTTATVTLGLADVRETLEPAVKSAMKSSV